MFSSKWKLQVNYKFVLLSSWKYSETKNMHIFNIFDFSDISYLHKRKGVGFS